MRRATIAKAGRTAAPFGFTDMARRRVRWRNVGRVACLAAAGVLIATHGRQQPAEAPRRLARAAPAAPTAPTAPAVPPARPELRRLPRLRDIPRLVLPRPRERRALKGGEPGRRGGVRRVNHRMGAQDGKPPGRAGGEGAAGGDRAIQAPAPSPPPSGAGQPATIERSAPTTGEFTPDRAP